MQGPADNARLSSPATHNKNTAAHLPASAHRRKAALLPQVALQVGARAVQGQQVRVGARVGERAKQHSVRVGVGGARHSLSGWVYVVGRGQ